MVANLPHVTPPPPLGAWSRRAACLDADPDAGLVESGKKCPGEACTSRGVADTGRGADMAKRSCIVDGCDGPRSASGLCDIHYRRNRNGIPLRRFEIDHEVYAAARFWSMVEVGHRSACWLWQAAVYTQTGYGQATDLTPTRGQTTAHRVAYELARGPIPNRDNQGRLLVIDHLCQNRRCVNPAHLEVVLQGVNCQRAWDSMPRTHCKQEHELSGDNRIVERAGRVRCRECKLRYQRRYDAKRRAS